MNSISKGLLVGALGLAIGLGAGWKLHGGSRAPVAATTPETAPDVGGGPVSLTPEQMQTAGVQVEVVRMRALRPTLKVAGNLESDPDLTYQIHSPISGRVAALNVDVGDRVRPGQQLLELSSPELARALAEHHHADIRYQLAQTTLNQRLGLFRLGDEARRPVEEARLEFAANQADAKATGSASELAESRLRRVEDLYKDGITSQQQLEEARATAEQARARHQEALAKLEVARSHRRREEKVYSRGLISSPKIAEARAEFELAREELEHTEEILQGWGVDPHTREDTLKIRAPRKGVVVERKLTLGQAVTSDQVLARIVDPRRLWLWVQIYEDDLGLVKVGDAARIRVASAPGRSFDGRISFLDPRVDPDTRTCRARVVVGDGGGRLKAGMFAQVEISLNPPRQALAVPDSAIQQLSVSGNSPENVVYQETAPGQFQRTPVKLGVTSQSWVEVKEGLAAGQKIAVKGVFLIKSQDLKALLGGEE